MAKQAKTKQEKITVLESIRQAQKDNPRIGIKRVCSDHGISTGTYYNWCRQEGKASLEPLSRKPKSFGKAIDTELKKIVIAVWTDNRSRSINAIHKFIESHDYKISYNTVRKIINEELMKLEHEYSELQSVGSEIAEHTFQKF